MQPKKQFPSRMQKRRVARNLLAFRKRELAGFLERKDKELAFESFIPERFNGLLAKGLSLDEAAANLMLEINDRLVDSMNLPAGKARIVKSNNGLAYGIRMAETSGVKPETLKRLLLKVLACARVLEKETGRKEIKPRKALKQVQDYCLEKSAEITVLEKAGGTANKKAVINHARAERLRNIVLVFNTKFLDEKQKAVYFNQMNKIAFIESKLGRLAVDG
ncbi:hypothetical protein HZB89_00475 [archaeon]|nr:hypothetical protein [archaeon]